jgi:2'-5' RNA ligase
MQVEGLHLPAAPRRVRVFSASDLHVTLGFLGSVQEPAARDAWACIGGFASFRPVAGSFDRVQALGHRTKPSALSAIVGDGREAMAQMISEARDPVLAAAHAAPDHRPPLPHMTLARIQRRAQSAERGEALRWAEGIDLRGISFTAPSVALYTWSLDRQERLFRIVEQHDL